MARPAVDTLAPTNTTASVAWGEFTQVYGGNVNLKPYTATQGDLSLEWYFAEHSIASVAVFEKRIKNQITTSFEPGQDIGVPGYLFNVIRPSRRACSISGTTASACAPSTPATGRAVGWTARSARSRALPRRPTRWA
jgi:outer membrane receptor protein involved in Fe transport